MFDPASMMITQTMKNVCEALAPHHRCNRHIHSKSVTPSPSSPKPPPPPPPPNTHTHTHTLNVEGECANNLEMDGSEMRMNHQTNGSEAMGNERENMSGMER